jgi:hypothetical protein
MRRRPWVIFLLKWWILLWVVAAALVSLTTLVQAAPIKRDREQVYKFRSTHPCPATGQLHGACPGHVVDHIIALVCGGADKPSNMQWQTVVAAKAKDIIEKRCMRAK